MFRIRSLGWLSCRLCDANIACNGVYYSFVSEYAQKPKNCQKILETFQCRGWQSVPIFCRELLPIASHVLELVTHSSPRTSNYTLSIFEHVFTKSFVLAKTCWHICSYERSIDRIRVGANKNAVSFRLNKANQAGRSRHFFAFFFLNVTVVLAIYTKGKASRNEFNEVSRLLNMGIL